MAPFYFQQHFPRSQKIPMNKRECHAKCHGFLLKNACMAERARSGETDCFMLTLPFPSKVTSAALSPIPARRLRFIVSDTIPDVRVVYFNSIFRQSRVPFSSNHESNSPNHYGGNGVGDFVKAAILLRAVHTNLSRKSLL